MKFNPNLTFSVPDQPPRFSLHNEKGITNSNPTMQAVHFYQMVLYQLNIAVVLDSVDFIQCASTLVSFISFSV